jgi:hypothetical protein
VAVCVQETVTETAGRVYEIVVSSSAGIPWFQQANMVAHFGAAGCGTACCNCPYDGAKSMRMGMPYMNMYTCVPVAVAASDAQKTAKLREGLTSNSA